MRSLVVAVLAFVMVMGSAMTVAALDVTLSWDPSPTETVTGYKIYYRPWPYIPQQWDGATANEGSSPIDAGNVLTYTITGLSDGVLWYFGVTAYDPDRESAVSNVVRNKRDGRMFFDAQGQGKAKLGGSGKASF